MDLSGQDCLLNVPAGGVPSERKGRTPGGPPLCMTELTEARRRGASAYSPNDAETKVAA